MSLRSVRLKTLSFLVLMCGLFSHASQAGVGSRLDLCLAHLQGFSERFLYGDGISDAATDVAFQTLRSFRSGNLGIRSGITPSVKQVFVVSSQSELPSERNLRRVFSRIRGLESSTVLAGEAGTGDLDDITAGFQISGFDEIEEYLRNVEKGYADLVDGQLRADVSDAFEDKVENRRREAMRGRRKARFWKIANPFILSFVGTVIACAPTCFFLYPPLLHPVHDVLQDIRDLTQSIERRHSRIREVLEDMRGESSSDQKSQRWIYEGVNSHHRRSGGPVLGNPHTPLGDLGYSSFYERVTIAGSSLLGEEIPKDGKIYFDRVLLWDSKSEQPRLLVFMRLFTEKPRFSRPSRQREAEKRETGDLATVPLSQ